MQRIIFYGMIIVVAILLIILLNVAIYWLLRIFCTKHLAHIISSCVFVAMALILGVSAWWGHTHTRMQIVVKEATVASSRLPKSFDGYRIAQISDLHINSFGHEEGRAFLARLTDTIRAQHPDLIVFTGDLVTIRAAESYPFKEALAGLSHIEKPDGQGYIPVYSILGNHDYADYARGFSQDRRNQDIDSLVQVQEEAGWHMLKNSSTFLSIPATDSTEEKIILAGVENIGEPPFSVYGDLDKTLAPVGGRSVTDTIFTVLLSHNPTHWRSEVIPRTCIDLTLSGHTHATQILIGSWSPAKWKYPEWMGLYNEGTQYLYVNTGIGCVGPAVRIGVPPEVTILTLRSK